MKKIILALVNFAWIAANHPQYDLQEKLVASQFERQHASWRDVYYSGKPRPSGCIMCRCVSGEDKENFIIKHYKHNTVILNLYPYTSWGHFLIAPHKHVHQMNLLDMDTKLELIEIIGICEKIVLTNASGANIGLNIGDHSGASIPEHLHVHVVGRRKNEAGFIDSVGNLAVLSVDLEKQHERFKKLFDQMGNLE